MYRAKLLIFLLSIMATICTQDFNAGPYGIYPFDIAGPFSVHDLNNENHVPGDINFDNGFTIQDIIIIISYILQNIDLTNEQELAADLNQDGEIDVQDVLALIDKVLHPDLYPLENHWHFELEWNNQESYVFIHYDPNVNNSSTMWESDRAGLIENSPLDVHYFFIANTEQAENDIIEIQASFDLILQDMDTALQEHWNTHLHFISEKSSELNNWLGETLTGRYGFGIDRFQRIREIGYLGNPNGFVGFYMSYIAHEPIYYNYEKEALYDEQNNYDIIDVFEREIYTGGWASTISKLVQFPNNEELDQYSGMSIELLRGCYDDNGNYNDDWCDDYDRIARMYICEEDESNCNEIARWITPFDRQPHHLTDISSFISVIRPGGNKIVKFQESGWPHSLLTMRFRFYHEEGEGSETPKEFQPMWIGTVGFNPDYNDNHPPIVFNVPENASRVELATYITGHGWGCDGFNCAEFCNSKHMFTVNGGVYEFETSYPEAGDNNYCMELETIAQGVIPNQWGTWGYGRAGWCPGQDVPPFITDITDYVVIGDDNVMEYTACRDTWNDCVEPPICPNNDCYCPEIAMSSYIIIWY